MEQHLSCKRTIVNYVLVQLLAIMIIWYNVTISLTSAIFFQEPMSHGYYYAGGLFLTTFCSAFINSQFNYWVSWYFIVISMVRKKFKKADWLCKPLEIFFCKMKATFENFITSFHEFVTFVSAFNPRCRWNQRVSIESSPKFYWRGVLECHALPPSPPLWELFLLLLLLVNNL